MSAVLGIMPKEIWQIWVCAFNVRRIGLIRETQIVGFQCQDAWRFRRSYGRNRTVAPSHRMFA